MLGIMSGTSSYSEKRDINLLLVERPIEGGVACHRWNEEGTVCLLEIVKLVLDDFEGGEEG